MRGQDDDKEQRKDKFKKKSRRGQEKEECRMESGGRAGLWLLLCRNVNTLQRSQKTMTPQGEEGVHVSVFLSVICVCVCVWVQQQHYGERKENDGGEMRERERGGDGEPTLAKLEI